MRWVKLCIRLSFFWHLCSSSVYSSHLFLISSSSVRSIPFLFSIEPIIAWNVPLVSLIFLKRSLVFPILLFSSFFCIDHWGRLSYLSLLFFETLHSDAYIFPFLLCFSLLFFSQLFLRPPQIAILLGVEGQGSLVCCCPWSCKELDTQMSDVAERFYPSPKIKGSDRKCQAATVQERARGATQRSEVRGGSEERQAETAQEQPRGATPRPRSGGCTGAGKPRGATPRSRSGGAAVRRYPSSKVRSSGSALQEQPWRDNPHPR